MTSWLGSALAVLGSLLLGSCLVVVSASNLGSEESKDDSLTMNLSDLVADLMTNDTLHHLRSQRPDQKFVDEEDYELFEWITEGVLLTTISGFGFFGNALSIYVLLRPTVRGTFSNILTGLATFDAAFLVLAILTFGLPTIAGDFYNKVVFPPITPICSGLIHTFRVGSAFATLSVTVERFFAIVFPLKDFRCVKKWLLPFTAIFTVVYNIPKFFEVTTVTDPETNETTVVATALRNNEIYVSVYVVWSKLILTELVPYFTILILNSFIIVKIIKSARFRRKVIKNHEGEEHRQQKRTNRNVPDLRVEMACEGESGCGNGASAPLAGAASGPGEYKRNYFDKQRQEHRLGILLVGISVLFISCQSFKIIPDVYGVIFCDKASDCETTTFITTCVNLSHLLVCFNSAANCIIYLLVGEKFRRVFCATFCPGNGCLKAAAGAAGGRNSAIRNGSADRDGIPLQTWTFGDRSRHMSLATNNTVLGVTGFPSSRRSSNNSIMFNKTTKDQADIRRNVSKPLLSPGSERPQ